MPVLQKNPLFSKHVNQVYEGFMKAMLHKSVHGVHCASLKCEQTFSRMDYRHINQSTKCIASNTLQKENKVSNKAING